LRQYGLVEVINPSQLTTPADQYAMDYGGNGVLYSAQAGQGVAQMVAGKG
jgi:hypothetical protein